MSKEGGKGGGDKEPPLTFEQFQQAEGQMWPQYATHPPPPKKKESTEEEDEEDRRNRLGDLYESTRRDVDESLAMAEKDLDDVYYNTLDEMQSAYPTLHAMRIGVEKPKPDPEFARKRAVGRAIKTLGPMARDLIEPIQQRAIDRTQAYFKVDNPHKVNDFDWEMAYPRREVDRAKRHIKGYHQMTTNNIRDMMHAGEAPSQVSYATHPSRFVVPYKEEGPHGPMPAPRRRKY